MRIDTSFDFTSDCPGYWDGYWDRFDGHGIGACDPDAASQTFRLYHQIVWSRELPCGKYMQLEQPKDGYLRWGDLYFGSDSITTAFRYGSFPLIHEVEKTPGYRKIVEDYIRKTYTIGGGMIFPVHRYSFNQARGMNPKIRDRWDLSLECIRRFYAGEQSPLSRQLESDAEFYRLFIDFKGFVKFFYLEDCITEDGKVRMWTHRDAFERPAFPQNVNEYWEFIRQELDFVAKRNRRIDTAVNHTV